MNSKSKRLAQITVPSLIWSASSLADVSSPQNPGYEHRWPRCNEAEGRCYCGTASQCKDMIESGVCKAPAPEAAIEDKDENKSEKRRVRDQRK
jgi:hypothetical protein